MSHITTIKTKLNNLAAIAEYVKKLGCTIVVDGQCRYFGQAKTKFPLVIKCPGRYDIGLTETPSGLVLSADWGYADFYGTFGCKNCAREEIVTKLQEGQNKELFIAKCKAKRWKIREIIDPVTGKEQIEVNTGDN